MPLASVASQHAPFGLEQRDRDSYQRSRSPPPSMRPSLREPPISSPYLSHPTSKDAWPHRSPRFDDRAAAAAAASDSSSLRSIDTKLERSSALSRSQLSSTTAATSAPDSDRLPPISSIDAASSDSDLKKRPRRLSHTSQSSEPSRSFVPLSDRMATRHEDQPPRPRHAARLGSPREGEASSVDWESHSERGSPRYAPRAYDSRIPPPQVSQRPASSLANPVRSTAPAYEEDPSYSRSFPGRRDAEAPRYRDERFADDRYADERYADDRRSNGMRETSPASRPLKRKSSFTDIAPRRAIPDPVAARERDDEWSRRGEYYYDRAHPRPADRGADEPEHAGPASSYPPYDGYPPSRYPREGRFSPRVRPASPPLPASDPYRGGSSRFAGPYPYDGPAGTYGDRRSGRYSPTVSPSFAHRVGPPAPPHTSSAAAAAAAAGEYYGSGRPRSPFLSEGRPFLPPPFPSRPGAPPAPVSDRRRRTPPMEPMTGRSPSPKLPSHSDPFYPDRRFYYPRERIEDPEVDEYYHDGPGRSRYASDPHYPPAPHDGYAGPSNAFLPPPVSLGVPSSRHSSSMGIPLVVPPPPPGHPSHGHHDGHPLARDYGPPPPLPPTDRRPVVGVPPAHVPPGPATGIAPPPRRRGKLPKPVTDLLRSWLLDHASHPYPTEDEKRSLCSMTGLTLQQVSNWFINARRRILLPGSNGSQSGSATAEQVKAAFRDQDSASPPPGSE